MNRQTYNLLLYFLFPVIWLYFLYRGFKDSRYLSGLPQRLGLTFPKNSKNAIHIHCASVGEVRAANPLIQKITSEYTNTPILITTTTPTGKSEVIKLITSLNLSQLSHCYLPIDWNYACQRFVKSISPVISILIETELWPNLLHHLSIKSIPILLANARLSDLSLKKYLKHSSFSKQIFSKISMITAQFESDSVNFQKLGVPQNKIILVGSVKFDIQISEKLQLEQQRLKQLWTNERPCWIAASIHPDEFDMILRVHQKLILSFPSCLLIAVPRHPERFELLKQTCSKMNFNFISRTDNIAPSNEQSVVVGDTMGELTLMSGAANIAFVGGSLIERGGHNPLEPAACGLPVIMGSSDYNFSDISQNMQTHNALELVTSDKELYQSLFHLFSNNDLLMVKSKAAKQFIIDNRGSVQKIMTVIKELLT